MRIPMCTPSTVSTTELSILRRHEARVQVTPDSGTFAGWECTLTYTEHHDRDWAEVRACTRHGENAIKALPIRPSMRRLHLPSRTRRFVRLSLALRAPPYDTNDRYISFMLRISTSSIIGLSRSRTSE